MGWRLPGPAREQAVNDQLVDIKRLLRILCDLKPTINSALSQSCCLNSVLFGAFDGTVGTQQEPVSPRHSHAQAGRGKEPRDSFGLGPFSEAPAQDIILLSVIAPTLNDFRDWDT